MTARLCEFCGWDRSVEGTVFGPFVNCSTSAAALHCKLNQENQRKFALRFKNAPVPPIVRSIRYQDAGKTKFGTYYEFLQAVE